MIMRSRSILTSSSLSWIVVLSSCGGGTGASTTGDSGIELDDASSDETLSADQGETTPDPDNSRPFPQAIDLVGIKPDHVDQAEMNSSVLEFYGAWQRAYVRESNGNTPGGGYYIEMVGTGEGAESSITTSEAHGYGMIIFALLAGAEPEARAYFDGFFNMFDHHRSVSNDANMSWIIAKSESSAADSSSATDGDLDIAYGLLLAHEQWGSDGTVDYLKQARRTITDGILEGDVRPWNHWLRLGDWDAWSDAYGTRSSDWMLDHLRAFEHYTREPRWSQAIDAIYDIADSIQRNHAPETGLMPDFILDEDPPQPAPEGYLDEPFYDFSENASRFPLRFAIDYGLYGDERTKAVLEPVVRWVLDETEGDLTAFQGRYHLDGRVQDSATGSRDRMAYIASMVAATTIDAKYQRYLNDGWDAMAERAPTGNYFDDTLQLLAMLYITGNWWAPEL